MHPIHDWMPVIIPTDQYRQWLDKNADENETFQLLGNDAYGLMTTIPISDYVNNPRHNDQHCIQSK